MVDPGDSVADEAPVSTPDSSGDAQEKTGRCAATTRVFLPYRCSLQTGHGSDHKAVIVGGQIKTVTW